MSYTPAPVPDMYGASLLGTIDGLPTVLGASPPAPLDYAGPASIANLKVWYRASDFDNQPHGSEVAIWQDRSGNQYHAFALNGTGQRPLVSRNSINSLMTSVSNDGVKRGLQSTIGATFLASKTTWTQFCVFKCNSRASEWNPASMFVTGNVTEIRIGTDSSSRFLLTYGNVAAYASSGMLSIGDWHYVIVVSTAGVITFFLDGFGSSLAWITTPTIGGGNTNPTDIHLCEGTNTGPVLFNGNLAEYGAVDRAITAAEITSLNSYFQQRYGLT